MSSVAGTPASVPAPEAQVRGAGPSRRGLRRQPLSVWFAEVWIAIVVLAAVLADVLPLHRYDGIVIGLSSRTAPGLRLPEAFGTDMIGRSVLSRLVYGARESLLIGLLSVSIAMAVGLLVGTAAGYFRGRLDAVITVVLDAVLSLPALVLLLAIASVGKRDMATLVAGLSIVTMPTFGRLARANALTFAARTSVTAARALGATHRRIIFRELLPEVALRVSSYAFLLLAVVIVAEGSLSFLGLGVPPPSPSWGGMINDARPYLETNAYLVFVPAACLLLTVVSFTIVGDRTRRHFDSRRSALS